MVSAKHQHESAIGIHMSPPSYKSLPLLSPSYPSRLSRSPGLSSLSQTPNSHWLSILHIVVYTFPRYSLHSSHPLLPPHPISISLFSKSESPFEPLSFKRNIPNQYDILTYRKESHLCRKICFQHFFLVKGTERIF